MATGPGAVAPEMLQLFDPATQEPPADAIELYLEAPLTVGLLFHLATEDDGLRHLLTPVEEAREAGVTAALVRLGEVKVGDHYPGRTSRPSADASPPSCS